MTKLKLEEIKEFIPDWRQIFCLTETNLVCDKFLLDDSFLKKETFRNRENGNGGGIMILYKNNDNLLVTQKQIHNDHILLCEIKVCGKKIILATVYYTVNDKILNREINDELVNIMETNENEAVLILGDFNAHLGFVGEQEINFNGKLVVEIMEKCSLTLLNCTNECEGTYTWSRGNQRSVIDFVLANQKACDIFDKMLIDEKQEKFDISDHNLIEIELKVTTNTQKVIKPIIEKKSFYSCKPENIEKYLSVVENKLINNLVPDIQVFDEIIKQSGDEILKKTITIKHKESGKQDAIWFSDDIKNEIKLRKLYNRSKRNESDPELKLEFQKKFEQQKKKVQTMVSEAIQFQERKMTQDIKNDVNRGKKIMGIYHYLTK